MKKVEVILSQTYLYKGKVFEKGKGPYAVTDKDAKHLLAQRNERDIPYFRASEDSPAMIPGAKRSDKGGKPRVAAEPGDEVKEEIDATDDEVIAEVADDDDDDEGLSGLDDDDGEEEEDDPEAVTV